MIDWNALGLPPPEGAAGPRPPAAAPGAPVTPSARAAPAAPAAPAPTASPPATSPAPAATTATAQRAPAPPGTSGTGGTSGTHGFTEPAAPARPGAAAPRAATSGLGATVDRLRHGYAGTVAGGLWSAVPGVEQVHRVGRIGSAWFGEDRLRPPPSRRDAMGNAVGYSRTEINPQFVAVVPPSDVVIATTFDVELEKVSGTIKIVIPYATLEPIRELLLQMFMGEKFGRDSIWENHLATQLWRTEVDIEAVLDQQMIPLKDVMELKVGSRIMFDATPDGLIDMRCGDKLMFRGRMGRRGQYLAVAIDEKILGTEGQ
jgi:hypothetical protein